MRRCCCTEIGVADYYHVVWVQMELGAIVDDGPEAFAEFFSLLFKTLEAESKMEYV